MDGRLRSLLLERGQQNEPLARALRQVADLGAGLHGLEDRGDFAHFVFLQAARLVGRLRLKGRVEQLQRFLVAFVGADERLDFFSAEAEVWIWIGSYLVEEIWSIRLC